MSECWLKENPCITIPKGFGLGINQNLSRDPLQHKTRNLQKGLNGLISSLIFYWLLPLLWVSCFVKTRRLAGSWELGVALRRYERVTLRKFLVWLAAAHELAYPSSHKQLIEYMQRRHSEPYLSKHYVST